MNEVLNYLPEISTAAGYALGFTTDVVTDRYAANRREATISTWGLHEQSESGQLKGRAAIAGKLVAPLALVGALTGGTVALAWSSQATHRTLPPVLEEVVDHSFETGLNGTLKQNNAIALSFEHDNSLNVRAYVAHNGGYDPLKLNQLTSDAAYGPASLDGAVMAAMTDAFNNSVVAYSNLPGTKNRRSAALLIETDDHSIGDVGTVVNDAKQSGELPIFIVNTGDSGDPKDQTAKDLRSIANQTGGQYWSLSKSGANKLADQINKTVTPNNIKEPTSSDNKSWLKVLSLISTAAFAGLTVRNAELRFKRRQAK